MGLDILGVQYTLRGQMPVSMVSWCFVRYLCLAWTQGLVVYSQINQLENSCSSSHFSWNNSGTGTQWIQLSQQVFCWTPSFGRMIQLCCSFMVSLRWSGAWTVVNESFRNPTKLPGTESGLFLQGTRLLPMLSCCLKHDVHQFHSGISSVSPILSFGKKWPTLIVSLVIALPINLSVRGDSITKRCVCVPSTKQSADPFDMRKTTPLCFWWIDVSLVRIYSRN